MKEQLRSVGGLLVWSLSSELQTMIFMTVLGTGYKFGGIISSHMRSILGLVFIYGQLKYPCLKVVQVFGALHDESMSLYSTGR